MFSISLKRNAILIQQKRCVLSLFVLGCSFTKFLAAKYCSKVDKKRRAVDLKEKQNRRLERKTVFIKATLHTTAEKPQQ